MAAKRIKKADMPKSIKEVVQLLGRLGLLLRRVERHELTLNDRIQRLKETHSERIGPISEEIDEIVSRIQFYADTNRSELTEDDKFKSVKFGDYVVRWRLTPKSVTIRGADKVLQSFRDMGLERFIRNKPEINKTALLQEPDVATSIDGVSITQREEFVIILDDTQSELVRRGKLIKGTLKTS